MSSLYVDELFQELSQLPPEEREVALAERCADDPATEAQLRALLSAETTFGQEPATLDPGSELGRYRLERKLGEGATAAVWQAWDTHLRAYTALKLLHAEHVRGDGALKVVLHEARAASSIISDHVVRIKTAGRLQDGPPFIEMELCAEYEPTDDGAEALTIGSSLSEVVLPSVADKVRVVAEAARGVEAAHRIGVLHRDLKPGNILLTPVSRRAKVTDFGLAADQVYPPPTPETGPARTVTVTTTGIRGAIVGTPAYMPPEQARGEPPTRTTDVYALGATLYALLAGDHPYLPRDDAKIPALDVLDQVRKGPPDPLRQRARVPSRLVRIIERAMARSPRRRYPTAAALAADLEAWLAGHATKVDGRAPLLRTALFLGRHRAAAITVGLLLLVLVGFGTAVGFLELRRQDLTAAIGDARATMVDYRSRIASFEEQVAEAAEQLEATEVELADVQEAHRRALRSESAAERRYRVELTQRRAVEDLLRERDGQIVVVSETLAASESERESLLDELVELQGEKDQLDVDLLAANESLALADRRIADLERESAQLVAERDAAFARLEATAEALAEAEARLGTLRAVFEVDETPPASEPPPLFLDMTDPDGPLPPERSDPEPAPLAPAGGG